MNENKDLKTIKECIHQIRWSDADGEYDMIIDAAERMAAEIERLETADVLSDEVALKNTKYIEELEAEITQLKAELEKRPEISCENCKYQTKSQICYKTGLFIIDQKFICSYGQRRESEEGK